MISENDAEFLLLMSPGVYTHIHIHRERERERVR